MHRDDAYVGIMGSAVRSLTADAVAIMNADTEFVRVNTAFSRIFGYSETEALGLSLKDLSTIGPGEVDKLLRPGADGQALVTVHSYRCRDGGQVEAETRIEGLTINGQSVYCAVMRDLTDLQRAERRARESEDRFRTLAAASFEGIALTVDGRIVDGNDQLSWFLGAPLEELIGRRVLDFIAPEWREPLTERFKTHAGEPFEHVIMRVDGSRFFAESQARTLKFPGRALRVTALRDISRRKRLEEQLQRSQRLESIGRLAGGVAHDFNNLLTVILSVVDMMLERERSEEEEGELQQIQEAAERASDLTQQLLSFARRRIIEPRVVDLNWLVGGLESMLRRLLGEQVDLVISCADEMWAVRIDPGQIEQVVVNLAINARDAMESGGTLTIETQNVDLGPDYTEQHPDVAPGQYAMIAVSDTGAGMDANTVARIFEPFFTTKATNKGSGLGLATCYGIVKQCDGTLTVYSEPGCGSTFKVYLPRSHEAVTSIQPKQTFAPKPGHECVLLVEDDAMVRRVAARALSAHGYRVIEAATPSQAKARFAKYRDEVKVVITDVVLPEMNGKDLVEALRGTTPNLRALYTSGYTQSTITHRQIVDEGVDFLPKPYLSTELAQRLREILDRPTLLPPRPLTDQ